MVKEKVQVEVNVWKVESFSIEFILNKTYKRYVS